MAKVINQNHEIMSKPLPDILDEIMAMINEAKQAAIDAEGHSADAKAYADKAKAEARDGILSELNKLAPRISAIQEEAGKAVGLANNAQASSDKNSAAITDLAGTVKNLGTRLITFIESYFARQKEARENMMGDCSEFIQQVPPKR